MLTASSLCYLQTVLVCLQCWNLAKGLFKKPRTHMTIANLSVVLFCTFVIKICFVSFGALCARSWPMSWHAPGTHSNKYILWELLQSASLCSVSTTSVALKKYAHMHVCVCVHVCLCVRLSLQSVSCQPDLLSLFCCLEML